MAIMKKRKLGIASVIIATLLASAACNFVQFDSKNVKVIEKPTEITTPKSDEKNNEKSSETDDLERLLQAATEEQIKNVIEKRALEVLGFIRDYDLEKLASAIHPEKGVRFTPYGYIDVERDLVFKKDELIKQGKDATKHIWGSYDGIGEPIELTMEEYWNRFVYDADFINADEVGYNKTLGMGNSINNSKEVYSSALIVEYHFPGLDPKYEGMDWRSLRLAFEKVNDTWYLVGIIHDQWTI